MARPKDPPPRANRAPPHPAALPVAPIDFSPPPPPEREFVPPPAMYQCISYDGIDDAIAKANDTMYGLHGAVYTADPERGFEIARRVRSGSVTVNGLIVDYKMPFGGFKQSGVGREGGIEGLENYFETKTIYM
jgi:hypothetical protein